MAYAEESCVPEGDTDLHGLGDLCHTYGDPFQQRVRAEGLPLGVQADSSSRKRLSPEGLAEEAGASKGDARTLAWQAAANSAAAKVLECGSDGTGNPNLQRMRSPSPRTASASEMMSAHGKGSEVASAHGKGSEVGSVGLPPHHHFTFHPPPEQEVLPHEVPVLALAEIAPFAATAGSVFDPPGAPGAHDSSQGQREQPYSALLSGPGFSYGAGGDGVFETDVISMGSLDSGSMSRGGFMIDDDADEEDGHSDGGVSMQRSGSIAWSAGTAGSGSGERAVVMADAALLPPAADATAGGAAAGCALAGVNEDACVGVGADCGAARSGAIGDVAATERPARSFEVAAIDADVAAVGALASHDQNLDDEDDGDPPLRTGSSESVGSAGAGRTSDAAAGAASRSSHAAALVGGLSGHTSSDAPDGGAAAAAWLRAADVAGVAAAAAAATGCPRELWMGAGGSTARTGVVGPGSAAAGCPLPVAHLQPPSLLPPEVYLGFVSQLVASVRTATRAASDACCAQRRVGAGSAAACDATGGGGRRDWPAAFEPRGAGDARAAGGAWAPGTLLAGLSWRDGTLGAHGPGDGRGARDGGCEDPRGGAERL